VIVVAVALVFDPAKKGAGVRDVAGAMSPPVGSGYPLACHGIRRPA
jgi:hypothetical protein